MLVVLYPLCVNQENYLFLFTHLYIFVGLYLQGITLHVSIFRECVCVCVCVCEEDEMEEEGKERGKKE